MSDLELCYLPGHEALKRFKAKTLSPVELVQALIDRAGEVEPKINAFTFTHFDEALICSDCNSADGTAKRQLEIDGRLAFCSLTPTIEKTFNIMGLTQYASIYSDEETALANLA